MPSTAGLPGTMSENDVPYGQSSRSFSTNGSRFGGCEKSNAPASGLACLSRSVNGFSPWRSSMNFRTDENS